MKIHIDLVGDHFKIENIEKEVQMMPTINQLVSTSRKDIEKKRRKINDRF